jgi:vacuolar iron transporter family protein
MNNLTDKQLETILVFQKAEITEYYIYSRLAKIQHEGNNAEVLNKIAEEEKGHADFWKKISGKECYPNRFLIFWYYWISRFFGLTFGVKLMEKTENNAQKNYAVLVDIVPETKKIIEDENRHENQLLELLQEEKLEYIGSVVLGLNDALVELTGALAGLSFAMQNNRIIGFAGLITGIAASFSMAASNYLSKKAEGDGHIAVKSALYTGTAYIFTVLLLVMPYWIFSFYLYSLFGTLSIAVFIILIFNYYISVAKDLNFKKRFFEMAGISLGVSAITFTIGWAVRKFMGVNL